MSQTLQKIESHIRQLKRCRQCPDMISPVVVGRPVHSEILLIGQAPGPKEGGLGRPFAWTAGKTLFRWFSSIGLEEEVFRSQVYMAAVCRCFPGKNPKGGDRVPNQTEIANCLGWLEAEFELLKPKLVIPVGKLAISQLMPVDKLRDVIGKQHSIQAFHQTVEVIPLPHPSGASTWHRMEPGKTLLQKALKLIKSHESFKRIAYSRHD